MEAVIEFIKILVPASVVLFGVFWIVKMFITKEIEVKQLEVRARHVEHVLPNRLSAYERMTLFLERMAPQSLLVRVNQIPSIDDEPVTAREFQLRLLADIRNEYDHNVAQQIYISDTVWNQIKNAKENLIITINDAGGEMNEESTAMDLSRKIFEKTIEKNIDPLAHALSELKKEIQVVF
jgi:predicted DNA-binding protein (UPF0251 family)